MASYTASLAVMARHSPHTPPLPTMVIGNHDLSMEAPSMHDLDELADGVLPWDIRDQATAAESARERQP